MFLRRCVNLAAIVVAGLVTVATAAPKAPPPRAVEVGRDGRLAYHADPRGNRIPDFSYCGYAGGDSAIPNISIRIVVSPKPGDQTARIQSAIDHVASLAPDEQGLRGTVLLQPGRYEIAGGLRIPASGVVLRGSGMGERNGTVLFASGHDRRTLITVSGTDDRKLGERVAIADSYVPVNATRLRVAPASGFKVGDAVAIRRACSQEWISALGMASMGGERHGFSWKPDTRELLWDRTITHIDGDEITIDAPLTNAIELEFGGGTIATYTWPSRIANVGIEHLRCESAFDPANPKDENHSWFAVTMEHARDAWVRQVAFAHFAGSAVAVWDSCKRITVEDCKSLAPVSEIGGHRRHAFFTAGQQALFQRCYSERGRHDFAVGFCAAGPNAFVQCEALDALEDSGAIDSWAVGVLFDNVRIDGNALSLRDRRYEAQGAGWSAANSMLWQCNASVIHCFSPPTATNWAVGCWGTFDGNGMWQASNESVRPASLYYAQLADRIGRDAAEKRAHLMLTPSDASSSPTVEEAVEAVAFSRQPAPQLLQWIDEAAKRDPILVGADGAKSVDDLPSSPAVSTSVPRFDLSVKNGWLLAGERFLAGGRTGVMWWRGGIRPHDVARAGIGVTRFVPGRTGPGTTDDLEETGREMSGSGIALLDHNYGLWYDRRRDDHQRVRRLTGDAWPPFYEQPFARSGVGLAWDGLSKFDLTKYNPWYWDRLSDFAGVAERSGLALVQNHYFQHNILEAGAHYADFPWRTANNINATDFPEPPPYAGDKRIFLAEPFYDVSHPTRRSLHRAYIRQCLGSFVGKPGESNVIHMTSAEFTGPLHFVQFWLDTVEEWEKETGRDAIVGLSATKDVQDAILADPARAPVVSVIEMKQWWCTTEGGVYEPKGGQNLAPRQHLRVWKGPKDRSDAATARQVREYRKRFPDKAILCDYEKLDGWAALAAGASVPPIRASKALEPLLQAIPAMQPYEPIVRSLAQNQWALAELGKNYLAYSLGDGTINLELPSTNGEFAVNWIDPSSGEMTTSGTVGGGAVREFVPPSGRRVLWVSRR
jgi:hypothetical protein